MKDHRPVFETLFLILQIGITMMVTFGLCFAIGLLLDRKLGTNLLWVFILLGIASGYRAVYLLVRRFIKGKTYETEEPEWAKRAFHPDDEDPEGSGCGKDSR